LTVPVQQRLQALDSRGVVFNVRPFEQFVSDAVAPRRFNLWLFTAFGFLAALLAAAEIYATMNFAVVQQNREIGIRVALGAQKGAVMKLILGEGAILVCAGLVIGFSASLADLLPHGDVSHLYRAPRLFHPCAKSNKNRSDSDAAQ
jgi:putative ABC transport system permease protein